MSQWFHLEQKKGGRTCLQLLLLLFLLHSFLISLHQKGQKPQPLLYLHVPPPPTKYTSIHGEGGGGGGITLSRKNKTRQITQNDLFTNQSNGRDRQEEDGETRGEMEELREVLEEVLHLVTSPTYTCRKMVAMGGYSCNYKADGEKYVCHDPAVYAWGVYCLVYALGAGHDFTFDTHMAKFGCEVFTFDDDDAHRSYPTQMGERMWFYKIRVGTNFVKQYLFTSSSSSSSSTKPQVISYGPLPAIRSRLGHQQNHLHYLKVDIEGQEWEVLEESIFKSDILQHTQQLGLEIHLDGLKGTGNKPSPPQHLLLANAKKYLRVLKGLKQRGFHLAHWEPNYRGSEVITVAGLTFHVYSETLWVNLNFRPKRNMPSKRLPPLVL